MSTLPVTALRIAETTGAPQATVYGLAREMRDNGRDMIAVGGRGLSAAHMTARHIAYLALATAGTDQIQGSAPLIQAMAEVPRLSMGHPYAWNDHMPTTGFLRAWSDACVDPEDRMGEGDVVPGKTAIRALASLIEFLATADGAAMAASIFSRPDTFLIEVVSEGPHERVVIFGWHDRSSVLEPGYEFPSAAFASVKQAFVASTPATPPGYMRRVSILDGTAICMLRDLWVDSQQAKGLQPEYIYSPNSPQAAETARGDGLGATAAETAAASSHSKPANTVSKSVQTDRRRGSAFKSSAHPQRGQPSDET